MAIIKWAPMWDPFEEMDKFWHGLPNPSQMAGFTPALDIYQNNDNVIVETPLAAISPEEVKISIENDVLTLEGKTGKKSEVEETNYYRQEVKYGAFHRSVALPTSVNGEKAKAVYEDGLLKITIPKEERAKTKEVKVEIKK